MKHYYGEIGKDGFPGNVRVEEEGKPTRPLPLRLDLRNASPTGFAWGYAGSGPAQLALALLADATGNDALALRLHQRFKFAQVATWKQSVGWHMSQAAVVALAVALAERAGISGHISND